MAEVFSVSSISHIYDEPEKSHNWVDKIRQVFMLIKKMSIYLGVVYSNSSLN